MGGLGSMMGGDDKKKKKGGGGASIKIDVSSLGSGASEAGFGALGGHNFGGRGY
jgi:hypothetical protein